MRGDTERSLHKYYDEHPDAVAKKAAEAIGCPLGTASSAKHRWKQKRKAVTPSISPPVEPKQDLTPEAIADSLLIKAVEAITNYQDIVAERNSYRSQIRELQADIRKVTIARDRILKIHNEQVAQRRLLPDLDKLLGTSK